MLTHLLATTAAILLAVSSNVSAVCPGQRSLPHPVDPSQSGPWPVGSKTLYGVTSRNLTVEIWYPAVVGSEAGKSKFVYDIRQFLPEKSRGKISDEKNPPQVCDCYQELPLDVMNGPYPIVEFIHGTAGFRTQSLHQMTHLASRGFVVVAMDCPGIDLSAMLKLSIGKSDQVLDGKLILAELNMLGTNPSKSQFRFLEGAVDLNRIAAVGHSAGGNAVTKLGDLADVIVPLSAGSAIVGSRVKSALIFGGLEDKIISFSQVSKAYSSQALKTKDAPALVSKRLVGVSHAGHLLPTDLCYVGREQGGLINIAIKAGIMEALPLSVFANDGCKAGQLPAEDGWVATNFALAAILEETLYCERSLERENLSNIRRLVPSVEIYEQMFIDEEVLQMQQ